MGIGFLRGSPHLADPSRWNVKTHRWRWSGVAHRIWSLDIFGPLFTWEGVKPSWKVRSCSTRTPKWTHSKLSHGFWAVFIACLKNTFRYLNLNTQKIIEKLWVFHQNISQSFRSSQYAAPSTACIAAYCQTPLRTENQRCEVHIFSFSRAAVALTGWRGDGGFLLILIANSGNGKWSVKTVAEKFFIIDLGFWNILWFSWSARSGSCLCLWESHVRQYTNQSQSWHDFHSTFVCLTASLQLSVVLKCFKIVSTWGIYALGGSSHLLSGL